MSPGREPPRPQQRPQQRPLPRASRPGAVVEVTLRQKGALIARFVLPPEAAVEPLPQAAIEARLPLEVEVRRLDPAATATRVRLDVGGETALVLRPGDAQGRAFVTTLREEVGDVDVTWRETADGDDTEARPAAAGSDGTDGDTTLLGWVRLVPDPEIAALHERLVAELEQLHLGLARDVLARTAHRVGTGPAAPEAVRLLRPEQEIERLAALHRRLDDALQRIGAQPSQALTRSLTRRRYRAGDRVTTAAVAALAREAETRVVAGRVRAIGPLTVLRTEITEDIAEHRHLRAGCERLRRRAHALAEHFARAAAAMAVEEQRWAGPVFATEALPRIRRYEAMRDRAAALHRALQALAQQHRFVAEAGPVRTQLAPTPIFMNRPGYREAYAVLVDARRTAGLLVAGDELRVRFKSLARLYEYWCFVQVVAVLREWLGPPHGGGTFALVDDVYRPDLQPGQRFTFAAGDATIRAVYEPDVLPEEWRRPPGPAALAEYRAALSTAPLRPDVLVEVARGDRRAAMVLDAKSKSRFSRDDLFAYTDYRTRVFDPATGAQPVRYAFFLHRDLDQPPLESLPGWLEGRRGDATSSVLGAVALLPDRTAMLQVVLKRFLELEQVL